MSNKDLQKIPRLLGGWDTSPEEYEALGYTVGLPPGYYLDDDNHAVEALKETMRSLWSDLISGPSSPNETIMLEDNFFHIYIRGFPEDYTAKKIYEELELNMKKFAPGYQGNGITNVKAIYSKKVCIVEFANEDVYQMFKNEFDNFVIGGRIVLCASWYTETEKIHNFAENIRTFLGNVVIYGKFDLQKIKKKHPEIININQVQTGFTIITFKTYDEALNFVLSSKNKIDAAILNFPPPKSYGCTESNLPINSVTTLDAECSAKIDLRKRRDILKGSDLKLSMILDHDINLSKPIDSGSLPNYKYNTLNIYNVIDKSLLSNSNALQIIGADMLEFCESFGKVENIEVKPPQFDFENYGCISITFKTAVAAQKCQKDISGRIYLGNVIITQLS